MPRGLVEPEERSAEHEGKEEDKHKPINYPHLLLVLAAEEIELMLLGWSP
jgi:hypothetical protein